MTLSLRATVFLAVLAFGCTREGESVPPAPPSSSHPSGATEGGPDVGDNTARFDCLTFNGLPIRVVATHDAPIFDRPGGAKTGEVHALHHYFLFAPDVQTDDHYHIGRTRTRDSVAGYASESNFVVWPTRQILKAAGRVGGEVLGYATFEALERRENPTVRLRLIEDRFFGGFPVIGYRARGGREFYQIAVLTGEPVDASERRSIIQKLRAIEIVICIDTTSSMKELGVLKSDISRLAARIARLPGAPRVSWGLYGYRDRVPGIGYVTHNYLGGRKLLDDLAEFQRKVSSLERAPVSSFDYPEAVFDGLTLALDDPDWSPGAERLVLLIGDNRGFPTSHVKNPDRLSVASCVALAGRKNVTVCSLFVPGSGSENEFRLLREQFTELADKTGGVALPSKNHTQLLDWIGDRLHDRARSIEDKVRVVSTGGQRPVAMSQERYSQVWELLRRNLDSRELESLRGDATRPAVECVWVERSRGGASRFDEFELITWSELKTLESNLDQVHDLLRQDRDWILQFFERRRAVAAGLTNDWLGTRTGRSLESFLEVKGIPIRRGLLGLTAERLRSMPASEREELAERLRTLIARLDLFHDVRNFREYGGARYGFLPIRLWDQSGGMIPGAVTLGAVRAGG